MQNENVGSLFKNCEEFQDSDIRILNHMQGPSKHGELCDGPGCMPMKPVPEYRWELMKPTGLGHQNWVISSDWMAP